MKQILLYAFLMGWGFAIVAQNSQFSSAAESDPEAKEILDKLRKKYQSYSSIQADFSLEIEIPEQPKEVQKGAISQKGEKYNMSMSSYSAISDGTSIWLILHNNKEVQINDVPEEDEDDSILSPKALLSLYENGDFVFVLANTISENGKILDQIEFKPIDRDSEYSKLRMSIDKKANNLVRVKAFSKDGSRYTFLLDKITPNKTFADTYFSFDKAQYQDYYVEDLRE